MTIVCKNFIWLFSENLNLLDFTDNITHNNDAPYPWQIAFQDPASPGFQGIFDFHDNIFFYLIYFLSR